MFYRELDMWPIKINHELSFFSFICRSSCFLHFISLSRVMIIGRNFGRKPKRPKKLIGSFVLSFSQCVNVHVLSFYFCKVVKTQNWVKYRKIDEKMIDAQTFFIHHEGWVAFYNFKIFTTPRGWVDSSHEEKNVWPIGRKKKYSKG